jgi:hypothetical protein
MVPHVINDILGHKMVVAPPLDKDISSPQPPIVGGKVADV